jgi:GntR family transcriptional regulator
MNIFLRKKSPLSLREQIKRQIKMLIESGELKSGEILPSARDFSAILNVNRNTITQAYKELAGDGILTVTVGSGTFVKEDLSLKPRKEINQLFDRAVAKARRLGFNLDEIAEGFLNRLATLSTDFSRKRVLVVDCNDELLGYLCKRITGALGVQTEGILIQKLEENAAVANEILHDKDLVVCGLNHLEELKKVVPDPGVEVVAILIQPDAKVLNYLSRIPAGTRVGYVCANQRSAETLYNSSFFSGGNELRRILAGFDSGKQLKKVIEECDIVFATKFIYARMRKIIKPGKKLIRVDMAMDATSLEFIKERLLECPKSA